MPVWGLAPSKFRRLLEAIDTRESHSRSIRSHIERPFRTLNVVLAGGGTSEGLACSARTDRPDCRSNRANSRITTKQWQNHRVYSSKQGLIHTVAINNTAKVTTVMMRNMKTACPCVATIIVLLLWGFRSRVYESPKAVEE